MKRKLKTADAVLLLVFVVAMVALTDAVLVVGTISALAAAFGIVHGGLFKFWIFSLLLRVWLLVWHYEFKEGMK